jgi:hypothetical protein
MFLASLPPGFPQNPNVLLIRTHPNPFPSVGYTSYIVHARRTIVHYTMLDSIHTYAHCTHVCRTPEPLQKEHTLFRLL